MQEIFNHSFFSGTIFCCASKEIRLTQMQRNNYKNRNTNTGSTAEQEWNLGTKNFQPIAMHPRPGSHLFNQSNSNLNAWTHKYEKKTTIVYQEMYNMRIWWSIWESTIANFPSTKAKFNKIHKYIFAKIHKYMFDIYNQLKRTPIQRQCISDLQRSNSSLMPMPSIKEMQCWVKKSFISKIFLEI